MRQEYQTLTFKEIYNANKLIGEYLGKKMITKELFNLSIYAGIEADFSYEIVDYTRYHKEWNWIMPVIEKIETTAINLIVSYMSVSNKGNKIGYPEFDICYDEREGF